MLDIVYEDNQILVVIKPHNVPTQADSSNDEDLLTMCKQYLKETYNKPGEAYLGMVHRLDRPTGGLICFAKTSKAASRISESIRTGEFKKKYLTVVCGRPLNQKGELTHYLKKHPTENIVQIVTSTEEGAKLATLNYHVLDSKDNLSLVDVSLETGRSHQIRVQMKSMNTPVYGDMKYGATKSKGFLALWSYRLEFIHPTTKKNMLFICYPETDDYPWSLFDKAINGIKQ